MTKQMNSLERPDGSTLMTFGQIRHHTKRAMVHIGLFFQRLASSDSGIRTRVLVLIRWIAVVGQAFTIAVVHGSLAFDLPLLTLSGLVLLCALSNIALSRATEPSSRMSELMALFVLAYDLIQTAILIAFTGGLQNPFSVLLLMPVALGAATLSMVPTIILCGIGLAATTLQSLTPWPLPWVGGQTFNLPNLYLFGIWTSLVIGLVLIATYSWRLSFEARKRSDALNVMQMALNREQQLAALGTIAAAAAHELGSPLTAIAVTAKEVKNELGPDDELAPDIEDIMQQTKRCRTILQTLSQGRHSSGHEPFIREPLSLRMKALLEEFGNPMIETSVQVTGDQEEPDIVWTPETRHALANIIDNAISFARFHVDVTIHCARNRVQVIITDDGEGITPDVLEGLGEPYVSSRHGQGGHGLGVFIAKTLLARSGAGIMFANGKTGAKVTVTWPRSKLQKHEGN